MKKTEIQIERDFYQLIKNSRLGAEIRGTVYRSEMRPADATGEDLIVKFLAGTDEQIQRGTVILNLYVPDINFKDGRKVADKKRIGVLQAMILDFIETCDDTDYLIASDGTPYSTMNPDIEQHLIVARIKFQRIS
jgi:hypothetical protein|nr:MAG TPA: hypothetical protein [Caudoviricetes sp.]